MLKKICLNCGRNIKTDFLCQECEIRLILDCRMRHRFIKIKENKLELFYFWDYKSVARKIINNGKYRFNKSAFLYLMDIIIGHYINKINFLRGTVTFVPTTYLRYCYRGFNQAELFAKKFTESCMKNKEVRVQSVLKRTKYTKAQAKQDLLARLSRESQFKVKNPSKIKGRIILFDDVCTTGATLGLIQQEISIANPDCKVICVTIAYTPSWKTKT